MSPVEYIKSIRMKKAAMLLQQRKFTVSEIMYMVGYSNASYFSKCFQGVFGKNPQTIRFRRLKKAVLQQLSDFFCYMSDMFL